MSTLAAPLMPPDALSRAQWWYCGCSPCDDAGRAWRAVGADRADVLRKRGVSVCYASAEELLRAGEALMATPNADELAAQVEG